MDSMASRGEKNLTSHMNLILVERVNDCRDMFLIKFGKDLPVDVEHMKLNSWGLQNVKSASTNLLS